MLIPCTNSLQTILMINSDEDYLGVDLISVHILHHPPWGWVPFLFFSSIFVAPSTLLDRDRHSTYIYWMLKNWPDAEFQEKLKLREHLSRKKKSYLLPKKTPRFDSHVQLEAKFMSGGKIHYIRWNQKTWFLFFARLI